MPNDSPQPLNRKELAELRRLSKKWMTRKATLREMEREMELTRRHNYSLRATKREA